MRSTQLLRRTIAATVAVTLIAGAPATAMAQSRRAARVAPLPVGAQRPTKEILLSIGEGELITLPTNVANVWTSNPSVADVYVNNPRQINLFGAAFGEATVFATTASGAVVYSANVRVSQNITSIDRMLAVAMPEAQIKVTTVGQIAVLTGTVPSPEDSAQAEVLVKSLLNPGVNVSEAGAVLKIGVINRLKTATPLQVNLQVRIAEVSRNFSKNIGMNVRTFDGTSGFKFGLSQGRTAFSPQMTAPPQGLFTGGTEASAGTSLITQTAGAAALGLSGKLFGMDILSALDLGERISQVTTLSNPNLTALSGETASFLAGGELPIPIASGLGTVSVEYKQYGISLAYTPTVLSDGRISLRVRPEVSQLGASVLINGSQIPSISTRRVETTVELGSGQSLVIGGLLQNNHNNTIDKTPGLGDVPVLGTLFRSNGFQRGETELVIVITPYLVRPVNANDIKLPTDGYETPDDVERVLMGKLAGGASGASRPMPSMGVPNAMPSLGAATPAPAQAPLQMPRTDAVATKKTKKGTAIDAAPGFSVN